VDDDDTLSVFDARRDIVENGVAFDTFGTSVS